MKRLFLSLCVLLFLTAVFAEDVEAQGEEVLRTRKIIEGWEKWLVKHEITKAAIAISFNGDKLAEVGRGMDADDPAPIASLSKAVTGICIAKLVEVGKLTFSSSLDDIVPELGSPVTAQSLLSQTSGFTKDVTQNPLKYIGRDKEYLEWVSGKEISTGRDEANIGTYHYNNSNYAMFGAIIRKVTGKSYESACKALVFEPVGIKNAKLNEPWKIMSAWGGWKISAADYLKFLNAYFDRREVLDKSPAVFPNHGFENGVHYGMGYLFRKGEYGGFNFWHQGAWDYQWNFEVHRFGAYFVSFDSGWIITMNHNSSVLNGEMAEIDNLLGEATQLPL